MVNNPCLPSVQISNTSAKACNWHQRWVWTNGTRISVWNIPTHGAYCMGNPRILLGKSNSSRHSICGAWKNMVCDLREWNFPLLLSVCSADLDMHFSGSFFHHVKFYSFIFMHKRIDCKRWLFIDRANFVILWMLTMMIRIKKND